MMTVKVYADFPALGIWTADQEKKLGLYDVTFVKTLQVESSQAQLILGVTSLTLNGFSINLESTNFDLSTLHVTGTVENLTFASQYMKDNENTLDLFPVPDEEGAMTYFIRTNEEGTDVFKTLIDQGWLFEGATPHAFTKEEVINGDKCQIVIDNEDETVYEGKIGLVYKSDKTLKEVLITFKKGPALVLTEQQFDTYLFGVHNRFVGIMSQAEFDSLKKGK